jgi:hypothetical protein
LVVVVVFPRTRRQFLQFFLGLFQFHFFMNGLLQQLTSFRSLGLFEFLQIQSSLRFPFGTLPSGFTQSRCLSSSLLVHVFSDSCSTAAGRNRNRAQNGFNAHAVFVGQKGRCRSGPHGSGTALVSVASLASVASFCLVFFPLLHDCTVVSHCFGCTVSIPVGALDGAFQGPGTVVVHFVVFLHYLLPVVVVGAVLRPHHTLVDVAGVVHVLFKTIHHGGDSLRFLGLQLNPAAQRGGMPLLRVTVHFAARLTVHGGRLFTASQQNQFLHFPRFQPSLFPDFFHLYLDVTVSFQFQMMFLLHVLLQRSGAHPSFGRPVLRFVPLL